MDLPYEKLSSVALIHAFKIDLINRVHKISLPYKCRDFGEILLNNFD